jgi:glutamate-1-semialdehyde 2,1-aminomutase
MKAEVQRKGGLAGRDHRQGLAKLGRLYQRHAPKSWALRERAGAVLVDGLSHGIRGVAGVAPRIVEAKGAWVRDEDGHRILDFWQGHFANILGHNPECITGPLAQAFAERSGLQTGLVERAECELAEALCWLTGAERVRFTTSGALATMFAVLLARAFTGRDLVLKVGGGWHGAQPWSLKGVRFQNGFQQPEIDGLSVAVPAQVLVTRYNDLEAIRDVFRHEEDRIACFIVEPFVGAGGLLPAHPEFLLEARRLTEHYGALLVFDEVISGFRFRAGDTGRLFGVRADLSVFGKILGGGMPLAAVTGRKEVMTLLGENSGRVRLPGGTFSAHPAALTAGKLMLEHLERNAAQLYPRLAALGDAARVLVEGALGAEGIPARCSGGGNGVLPASSLVGIHVPRSQGASLESPDEVQDPELFDAVLGEKLLRLALLLENVHVVHGLGALSAAHNESDLEFLEAALHRAAERMRPYLG